jgi:hypothetical protein
MKKVLVVFSLILMTLVVLTGCGKPTTITKEQMLAAQINYSQSVFPIVNDMANSYSDYLAYNKSDDKFKADIDSYLKRYKDVEKAYSDFNKKYKLDEEASKDENLQKAVKDMEMARAAIKNILEGTIKNGKIISREGILELYIKEAATMQNSLTEFKQIIGTEYSKTKDTDTDTNKK